MDDNKYNLIKNEYISFKKRIEKEIIDNKNSYHLNECFLINDIWVKQLNKNFIDYEGKKKC